MKCPECGSHECPDFAAEIDNRRDTSDAPAPARPTLREALTARMEADRSADGQRRRYGIITYTELRAIIDHADADDYDWLADRHAAIITQVANALNGPPPPLTMWSHHDLGDKAEQLVAKASDTDGITKVIAAHMLSYLPKAAVDLIIEIGDK